MGLIRVELMTPSLSEKCSNRLSYRPYKKRVSGKNRRKYRFVLCTSRLIYIVYFCRRLNNLLYYPFS